MSRKSKKKQYEYNKKWRKNNLEKYKGYKKRYYYDNLEKCRERGRRCQQKIRMQVLMHYSGDYPFCSCCGEKTIEFLSIDHINGGGYRHKKDNKIHSIYLWLKRNNYPNE